MTPRVTDQRVRTVSASAAQDPFDLDISVIESGATVGLSIASDGGCGSTCGGNACISSGS
ncbi:FxLD family lanthipeptide [Streptomyces sp. ME02-6987-2C]|uniref:FxLD family lanthipeptide n=1 Tax=unclassified Streptomyces TaxID=2593676 RepID=UPI0029BD8652|nr:MULTISPECIES: FxLD family lanthipeptide [unclassified Streptomyces]MDX3370262.1 FxLD family lanthipeptide [Streptomyces sp. ME02-6987-2C]MDX3424573.1 FxLD family lanthipeptide [Streptomyces sp. ME02-6985-2c]